MKALMWTCVYWASSIAIMLALAVFTGALIRWIGYPIKLESCFFGAGVLGWVYFLKASRKG